MIFEVSLRPDFRGTSLLQLKRRAAGNIALALTRLDEQLTDEAERAHGKSQIYGAIGCWFDAWTVIFMKPALK